jgi:hypothetical protein
VEWLVASQKKGCVRKLLVELDAAHRVLLALPNPQGEVKRNNMLHIKVLPRRASGGAV